MQCLPYSIARDSSSSYCNIPDHHDVFKPIAVQSCISTMKATTNTGRRKSPLQPVYRARFITVAYRLRYRVYIWSDTLSLRYEYVCAWLCNVYQVSIVLRMCVVLVDGGGAKAVQKFVSLKIAAISVLAVILHPAWPCPFYTPAELAERPRRFRNSHVFIRPLFV